MPLGNLTSQFFANVYLNELDYSVKRMLRVKFYIRYVDDFVIDIGGEVAGSIWFNEIDYKNKKGEIGYWLAKKYWGNGIMTQAVRQLVKTGFSDLKLDRVYACVFTNNSASSKVLKKSGFELEGKLRKCLINDNKFRDSFLYAKVK